MSTIRITWHKCVVTHTMVVSKSNLCSKGLIFRPVVATSVWLETREVVVSIPTRGKLSYVTQHALPPEYGGKFGTECLYTRFPLLVLCAEYIVKLKKSPIKSYQAMFPIVHSSFLLQRVQLGAPLLSLVVCGDGLFHQLQDLGFTLHEPLYLAFPHVVEELSKTVLYNYIFIWYLSLIIVQFYISFFLF